MEVFLAAISLVMSVLFYALMLAYIGERIIEFFVKPILERYSLTFWTPYAALLFGAAISVLFGVDLFSPIAAHVGLVMLAPWAGYFLTAILVGGGSHLIHDVWPVPIELELDTTALAPTMELISPAYNQYQSGPVIQFPEGTDPAAVKQFVEAIANQELA
jgi:hypothetical protein